MNEDDKKQVNKDCDEDCNCDKEKQELEENWKRALADYQNLQKRLAKEKTQIVDFANSVLVRKLLPVLDNLEMMQKHSDEEGLEMIIKEFKRVLKEEGIEEIAVEGKEFDSQKMEAIESVEGSPEKVMEITRKGYMFKNKVLRPAEVKVGRIESEEK